MVKALLAGLVVCALLGPAAAANAATTFTVDTTDDPGVSGGVTDCPSPCDLRRALTASNNVAGGDTIDFEIGGAGVQTIDITNPLPGIIDPVTIDATTEDAWTTSTGPLVEITPSALNVASGSGLIVEEPTIVRGLIIDDFEQSGIVTVSVSGHTGSLTITGSYIGTDATGTACAGNGENGIFLNGGPPNTIGGIAPGERNVIACNTVAGVFVGQPADMTTVQGSYVGLLANGLSGTGQTTGVHSLAIRTEVTGGALGNVISGNAQDGVLYESSTERSSVADSLIGTDPTGTSARPNGRYGINIGGGLQSATDNVISGNTGAGVHVEPPASHVDVNDNNLGRGLPPDGASPGPPLGNGGAGVEVASGDISTVSIDGNVIANNAGDGVAVLWTGSGPAPIGINFSANLFDANGGLGIDLGGDGVTPNDPDPGSGPNAGQNYPVLTSVATGGGTTTVDGTLDSVAAGNYVVTFYVSASCDPSGYGEGQSTEWPTTDPIPTDADGHGSFTFSFPGEAPLGSFVTATARTAAGSAPGPSEFSQCLRVTRAPVVTTGGATGITLSGATLSGSANPNGLDSEAHFEYGPTTSYGASTAGQALGSGVGAQDVSASVVGLASATTYHYRLVATNSKGTSPGEDRTFTTTTPAGGGEPPGGGPVDKRAPRLRLVLRGQKLRKALSGGYSVRFDDDEAGRASVDILVKGKRVAHGSKKVSKTGRQRIGAKFTRKAKRSFKHRRKLKLLIRLTAVDAAGNKRTVRGRATLKR